MHCFCLLGAFLRPHAIWALDQHAGTSQQLPSMAILLRGQGPTQQRPSSLGTTWNGGRGSQEPEGYMLESDKKKGIGSLLLTGSLTVMWSFIPICWQGLGRVDRLRCPELSIPQDLLALGGCPCASFLLPGPFCGHSESPLRGGSSLK